MVELTHNNIKLYAAKNYENPACLGESEFLQDYSMVHRINNYILKKDILKDNVILRRLVNMIITFYNVFEPIAASRILFFHSDDVSKLKTLLIVLNRFPSSLEYYHPYELDIEWLDTLKKDIE